MCLSGGTTQTTPQWTADGLKHAGTLVWLIKVHRQIDDTLFKGASYLNEWFFSNAAFTTAAHNSPSHLHISPWSAHVGSWSAPCSVWNSAVLLMDREKIHLLLSVNVPMWWMCVNVLLRINPTNLSGWKKKKNPLTPLEISVPITHMTADNCYPL